ncbi:hypothetical protein SEA_PAULODIABOLI_219 [Microbacterium phage PauloDiaboli]|nr:hypothetical protein SEA_PAULODIABOLI_219 [Microbacterium phage PauloDiaboli]QWY84026.1 hypothetical protein SEA_A3WALLY_219 [Microbacterium phage A3Wally]
MGAIFLSKIELHYTNGLLAGVRFCYDRRTPNQTTRHADRRNIAVCFVVSGAILHRSPL